MTYAHHISSDLPYSQPDKEISYLGVVRHVPHEVQFQVAKRGQFQ
jgi:hypothetical protein